ncbi:hypothetical protein F511_13134 [Dorcoceras hygrometricum]|uniref:Uncharacterized protein n=1 Tax=Dorcoceras hygrometricum TaxID=472368 RepID=A0A2Z7CY69_9LAMI|nr:hypothetical protein F511_13134 [Dorcoceras hygrometricum]
MQTPAVACGKLLLQHSKTLTNTCRFLNQFSTPKAISASSNPSKRLKPADATRHAYVTLPMPTPAGCTRSTDEFCTNGFSSSSWPKTNFRRQRAAEAAAAAAFGEEVRGGYHT